MRACSAVLTVSTLYAVRMRSSLPRMGRAAHPGARGRSLSALRDDHGRGDPGVVAQGDVPGAHAQFGRAGGDRAGDPQPGLPAVLDVHLGVRPVQSGGGAERLGEGLLRGEAGGE